MFFFSFTLSLACFPCFRVSSRSPLGSKAFDAAAPHVNSLRRGQGSVWVMLVVVEGVFARNTVGVGEGETRSHKKHEWGKTAWLRNESKCDVWRRDVVQRGRGFRAASPPRPLSHLWRSDFDPICVYQLSTVNPQSAATPPPRSRPPDSRGGIPLIPGRYSEKLRREAGIYFLPKILGKERVRKIFIFRQHVGCIPSLAQHFHSQQLEKCGRWSKAPRTRLPHLVGRSNISSPTA